MADSANSLTSAASWSWQSRADSAQHQIRRLFPTHTPSAAGSKFEWVSIPFSTCTCSLSLLITALALLLWSRLVAEVAGVGFESDGSELHNCSLRCQSGEIGAESVPRLAGVSRAKDLSSQYSVPVSVLDLPAEASTPRRRRLFWFVTSSCMSRTVCRSKGVMEFIRQRWLLLNSFRHMDCPWESMELNQSWVILSLFVPFFYLEISSFFFPK